MKTKAVAKYLRVSPIKARITARHIIGQKVGSAISLLSFSPRSSAKFLLKVLESAVANATHNKGLNPDDLLVSEVRIDPGPVMKRWRPRAQGRAFKIRKRTSHITIEVASAN